MGDDDEAEGQLPPADDEGQDETTGGLDTSTQGTGTSDTDAPDTDASDTDAPDAGDGASPGSSEDPDSNGGGVDPKSIYGGG